MTVITDSTPLRPIALAEAAVRLTAVTKRFRKSSAPVLDGTDRALAQNCDVLLMDEPFAALDAITRDVLHGELTALWEQTGTTVLFVTHNVREAVRLGQRVILMSSRPGRIAREWTVDIPQPRRI